MTEMVERVARAISGAPYPSKASYRKARAAIEAMREPTERMVDPIFVYGAEIGETRGTTRAKTCYSVWRECIDAALRDGK